MAGALLIISKTNSSVTGPKVSQGISSEREVSRQALGLEEEIFSDAADSLSEIIRKDVREVVSMHRVEGRGKELFLPRMVLSFERAVFKLC